MPPVKPNHGSTHPSPPAAVSLFTGYTVNSFREEFLVKNPASAPFHCPRASVREGLRECSNWRHWAIHQSQPHSCPTTRKVLSHKEKQIHGVFCLQHPQGAGANEIGTRHSRCAAPQTPRHRRCRVRWVFPRSRAQETGSPRDPRRGSATCPHGSTDTAGRRPRRAPPVPACAWRS